jgi:hypothetical protein
MFEQLTELTNAAAAARKELREKGQALVKEALRAFLETHPQFEAVRWRQYTPYFNDGDACVFRVCEPEFKVTGEDDGGDDGDGFLDAYYLKDENKAAAEALAGMLGSDEMEDVLLATFDDHVQVTVTLNEITIDEYSHD